MIVEYVLVSRHCVIIIDRNAGEQLCLASTSADGGKPQQDTDKDDRPFPGPPKLAWMPTEDEKSDSPSPDPEEDWVIIELAHSFNASPSPGPPKEVWVNTELDDCKSGHSTPDVPMETWVNIELDDCPSVK